MEVSAGFFNRFFPYKSYRRGQLKTIRFLFNAFIRRRIALLSSPCGTGKSISVLTAYTAARSMGLNDRLMVLTRTRSQLEIYCREARHISESTGFKLTLATLTSRKYMCPKAASDRLKHIPYRDFLRYCKVLRSASAGERCEFYEATFLGAKPSRRSLRVLSEFLELGASTPVEVLSTCSAEGVCPYEVSKMLLREADVIVGNYNYIFIDKIRRSVLAKAGIRLHRLICVIDEAHSLPEYLTKISTESMSTVSLGRASRECEKYGSPLSHPLKRLESQIRELGGQTQVKLEEAKLLEEDVLKKLVLDSFDTWGGYGLKTVSKALQEEGERIRSVKISEGSPPVSYTSRVGLFVNALAEAEGAGLINYIECFTFRGERHYRVGVRALDPSPVCSVLNKVRSAVLMSGTLWDMDYYVEVLGLDNGRVDKLEVPYPFPEENRAIFIDAGVTTRYSKRIESEWIKIAEHIKALRNTVKGGVAFYFPSYEVMEAIRAYLGDLGSATVYENEETSFEEIYRLLSAERDATVMAVARGKVSEGVDFSGGSGSLLSAVIIVGLPYPKKTELQEALTRYFVKKFGEKGYEYANITPCVNALAQAAGRLIRKPGDRGLIIIMDSRATGRIAERFPEDWRRSMRVFRSLKTLVRAVEEFQGLWEARS